MNPQAPVGPQREFTDDALNAKFSYSFSRKQLIILVNVLRPLQFALNDIRGAILSEMLGEIERTAIQSISESDYKALNPQAAQPLPAVQTN